MRILLTGATGFIGSHLLPKLAAAHEVFALARRPPKAQDGVTWIEHDLAAPFDATRLPARVDAVIHLAQSRQYRDFPAGASDMFAINVEATFSLLEYARAASADTFVFASTGGIYAPSYEKLAETDPVDPLNFYLTSKHVAEQLIGNYRRFFETIVFRFFFVYGPGQSRMLIPTLVERVRRREPITVEGDPGIRINPIYVADAIRVFEPALMRRTSDVFNVAGDEVVSISDLARTIGSVIGEDAQLEHAGSGGGDLVGDNDRMKEVLGVRPETTLRTGLDATFAALER